MIWTTALLLLAQNSGSLQAFRPLVEAGHYDLGTFIDSGYLSRGDWGDCTLRVGTAGYTAATSPRYAFRTIRIIDGSGKASFLPHSLGLKRIEILDLYSGAVDAVDSGLTMASGRTIALDRTGRLLAVEGISVTQEGSPPKIVGREGIWLFSKNASGVWERRLLLQEKEMGWGFLHWTFDSSGVVLTEGRRGELTNILISLPSGSIRNLGFKGASPSPTSAVLASIGSDDRLILSDLNTGQLLERLGTRSVATLPKWSPDGRLIYYLGVTQSPPNACVFDTIAKVEYCDTVERTWDDDTEWVSGCARPASPSSSR